jgi:Tfp pilus assembly pilus retraction ATPase PilT
VDKQEAFLRSAARERVRNNKTKKIQRLADEEHQAQMEACVEYCILRWKQGNKSAEEALRDMEDHAKTMARKLT